MLPTGQSRGVYSEETHGLYTSAASGERALQVDQDSSSEPPTLAKAPPGFNVRLPPPRVQSPAAACPILHLLDHFSSLRHSTWNRVTRRRTRSFFRRRNLRELPRARPSKVSTASLHFLRPRLWHRPAVTTSLSRPMGSCKSGF